jgi:hypothetical protein
LETCLDIDKHIPLSLTNSDTLGFFYKLLNHNPTMGGTMNTVVHTLTTQYNNARPRRHGYYSYQSIFWLTKCYRWTGCGRNHLYCMLQ